MITMERLTTTDVKRLNKNRIFRLIHYADKISRQEIADMLQLSLPTVNQNLKILTEQNLVVFGGNFESTGGRKAQVISVNGRSKFAISVNLSDEGVQVALVDLNGEIICAVKKTIAISADDSYGMTVAELVEDIIKRNYVDSEAVLGVGITVPGIFDNENKIILSAPTMRIHGYPISNVTAHIPYPCRAMNDARANAYAEYWFDRKGKDGVGVEGFTESEAFGRSASRLYIMLNVGVGGSCIDSQRIQIGKHNRCGEFGHMTIHPGGRKCFCGKQGCFEAYVSSKCLSTDLGVTLDEFFAQLDNGNAQYMQIFNEYLDDLTTGINNLYIMSDGDVIVGGPVARYLGPYVDKIRKLLIKKYAFETDASYFSLAQCTPEQLDTGAALTFLGDFISRV